jgi:hypothetical protein
MARQKFTSFEDSIAERKEEMVEILEGINVENLKNEGLSLSIGGRTFKFTDLEVVSDEDLESKIRNEFREKLNTQQQRIREKINHKINELLTLHQQKTNELERRERELQKKFSEASMMPSINWLHAIQGLQVVTGDSHGELVWLFRGRYAPKFLTQKKVRKPIKKELLMRMHKDIIIKVTTKGTSVTGVSTHNVDRELSNFDHYHQQGSGDCWGSWKKDSKWTSPDDIIRLAKDALAVLESINEGSIARRSPTGLPKLDTILKNLGRKSTFKKILGDEVKAEDKDVWST